MMRLVIHPVYLAFFVSLGHTQNSSFATLFGEDGPQPADVANVVTESGWFEIPMMALAMTSPDTVTSMLIDVNATHADVKWMGPFATSDSSPTTITVRKRPWDGDGSLMWPAAIYDAYQALAPVRAANSVPIEMYAQAVMMNATQLVSVLKGQSLTMTPCPSTATNQSFLVWQNTAAGLVLEAVTRLNPSNGTVEAIQKGPNSILAAQFDMSTWLPQCTEAWMFMKD